MAIASAMKTMKHGVFGGCGAALVLVEAVDQAEHLIVSAEGGKWTYYPCSILDASDRASGRRLVPDLIKY